MQFIDFEVKTASLCERRKLKTGLQRKAAKFS
jgi:hypothetical protein